MNERKRHAERIGDGSSSLCASSVWADDNSLLIIGNVGLDVFAEQMATVQIVDWDVEEALVLRI